ncbi:hypothetical protein G6F42_014585 [Rhizopus arrhizus]|nr:hypothetical protein G6F42_014585 [Rhizopus arrhizus]
MSSNAESPKMALVSRANIVNSVIHHLGHEDPLVRVAAAWCMINWTWANSEENSEDLIKRCQRLRELGIEEKLKIMESDTSRDVRDRANSALEQLREVLADASIKEVAPTYGRLSSILAEHIGPAIGLLYTTNIFGYMFGTPIASVLINLTTPASYVNGAIWAGCTIIVGSLFAGWVRVMKGGWTLAKI